MVWKLLIFVKFETKYIYCQFIHNNSDLTEQKRLLSWLAGKGLIWEVTGVIDPVAQIVQEGPEMTTFPGQTQATTTIIIQCMMP